MKPGPNSERALILCPDAREGALLAQLLADARMPCAVCDDLPALVARDLAGGAGLALIADQALVDTDLSGLRDWIAGQPSWSDFPFIILTDRAETDRNPLTVHLSDILGNVSFVERPFQPTSLLSLARTAVRGRRRQYEARARIEELRDGQERLRFAQEAGRIGTFELVAETGTVNVSEAFCRLWGLDVRDTFALSELSELVVPQDRPRLKTLSNALPGDALAYVEYRIRRPDTGEVRWIARQGEPVSDTATGARRYFGVTYDITAQKRAEADLRESRDQLANESEVLELLNRTTSALAAELDPDKLVKQVVEAGVALTQAAYGAFFYKVPGAADDSFTLVSLAGADAEAFTVLGAPRVTPMFEPTFRGHSVVRSPDISTDPRYGGTGPHFGLPQGHLPVRSYLAVPVVSRSGDGVGALLFGHPEPDMFSARSERVMSGLAAQAAIAIDNANLFKSVQAARETLEQRVEERTRERDRMWRLSGDLLNVFDVEGRLIAVNRAWTSVLGWSEAELLSARVPDLIHPDDADAAREKIALLDGGAATVRYENRYRTREGGYRRIAWTASPEAGLFYAIGRDITEQREMEEQLRQSQKMEAVGQLTGGIAHDFNNLLQGITGSLDIVQRRIAQGRMGELERFISGAMTSANRAAALTHRLLAFSRRQPLDPKPVKANPLVASMEDLLRRTLGERIALELVLAGGLWQTLCDPNQLENAILNLCINARDAMPEGGRLTIETCNAHLDGAYAASVRDVRPGQYICICVTDTGAGMSPEVMSRAFDPFFTTKPIGQGTGLGLSMIYGFARQSEGYAKIYSEAGKGTTVKLYLPRYRGAAAADEEVSAPAVPPRPEPDETVLVVEDEPVVRGLIVEVLHELGYHALEAGDGPEGLKILQSDARIDLLVTDIGLPGLNGRQIADAARVMRPDLRVLFMTGYAENAAMANGFLEPGMEMITKPFPLDALALRLREMMERAEIR
ncbi:GAF domain-containing hybrid sensor histidine kinase/response regulator [Roseixanthobacter glucoisosaccharinicivorans]|uniref:GAF domain-containing hybrid sensor histidine kinase/response regulator n=1 Tax=Roseixanthobacter glucoisosaccharinicivorans TaxID=3119923 RepID=UPI00372826E8